MVPDNCHSTCSDHLSFRIRRMLRSGKGPAEVCMPFYVNLLTPTFRVQNCMSVCHNVIWRPAHISCVDQTACQWKYYCPELFLMFSLHLLTPLHPGYNYLRSCFGTFTPSTSVPVQCPAVCWPWTRQRAYLNKAHISFCQQCQRCSVAHVYAINGYALAWL